MAHMVAMSDNLHWRLLRFGLALRGGERAFVEEVVAAVDPSTSFLVAAHRIFLSLAGTGFRQVDSGSEGCLSRIYAAAHRLPPQELALLALWALERLSPEELGSIVRHDPALVAGRAAEISADLYAQAMQGGGCHILIAEDERITALELKEALEEMGHQVPLVTSSAGQAISAASLHRPTLAIIDVRLRGGTDGVSAAREIQEALGIPVIITTAFTNQEERAASIRPYAYLPKPWSAEDLLRTIQAVLIRVAFEALTPGIEDFLGPTRV